MIICIVLYFICGHSEQFLIEILRICRNTFDNIGVCHLPITDISFVAQHLSDIAMIHCLQTVATRISLFSRYI